MKEKSKEFVAEKRAVSPVIGVVLMVAVVVILAAVIGAFVLGLGGSQSTAPQAAFTYEDGMLTMSGGDTLESTKIEVFVNDQSAGTFQNGTVTAGSSMTINAGAGDTIRVVWSNPNGDNTATLWETEV